MGPPLQGTKALMCIPKNIPVKIGKRALGFVVDGGGSFVASVCPAG